MEEERKRDKHNWRRKQRTDWRPKARRNEIHKYRNL